LGLQHWGLSADSPASDAVLHCFNVSGIGRGSGRRWDWMAKRFGGCAWTFVSLRLLKDQKGKKETELGETKNDN
jgi:hypothetical protein